jgi:hypothetical protein
MSKVWGSPMSTLRPKPGSVLSSNSERKTVVVRVVETEQKLTVHTLTTFNPKTNWRGERPKDHKGTITHQKCLCVNGPLAGQRKIPDDVPDYSVYNRAWGRWSRTASPPKTVLVYTKELME